MVVILKLVILPFLKRYWYHLALIGMTAIAALSIRGCINERDARIAEVAARTALIARDSAQVAALRDSVVLSRQNYDSVATALRSALQSNSRKSTLPTVQRAILAEIDIENVPPAVVIELCTEFLAAADTYKRYADSTMAAQARQIENLQLIPQKVVEKSSKTWKNVALASLLVAATTVAVASK